MEVFSRTDLLDVFRRIASEVAEKDLNRVAEATPISELGIDSLGLLEIVGSLERHLRIQLPDSDLSGVLTIHDLLDAVQSRRAVLNGDG